MTVNVYISEVEVQQQSIPSEVFGQLGQDEDDD